MSSGMSASPLNQPRTPRGACTPLEHLVAQPSGKLDGGLGVLEPAREASRPGEPRLDHRLHVGAVSSLVERFLEQLGRPVEALELREQHKRINAQRAGRGIRRQLARDGPGTRPLSGGLVRAGREERPAAALAVVVLGGQPERLLRELGRDGGRTTFGSQDCRAVQFCRALGVGRGPREREVARTQHGVVDRLGDPSVQRAPLVAELAVEDRREDGMHEADRRPVPLDHAPRHGRLERRCRHAEPREQRKGRSPERRGDR
jgi:hypothetical protein